MPLLIILGIFSISFICCIFENCTTTKHIFTAEELEQMSKEMCGKHTDECSKILHKYIR